MRLSGYMITGLTVVSLAACSQSPQQGTETTTDSGHMASNEGGDSTDAAGDQLSRQAVHGQAVAGHTGHTAHTVKQGHSGEHRGQHGTTDGAGNAPGHRTSIRVGDQVPEFEVELEGRTWKLSELRKNRDMTVDGTLVLTFWCSFCHSCRDMERELDRLARVYQGQVGVIALDASSGETRETVDAFAKKNGLAMPIALNASGSAADIFGVNSTTTTVVIDSAGTLRYLGRFRDRRNAYAHEALKSVLAGTEVAIRSTAPEG